MTTPSESADGSGFEKQMSEEERIRRKIRRRLNKLWLDGYLSCGLNRQLSNIEEAMWQIWPKRKRAR